MGVQTRHWTLSQGLCTVNRRHVMGKELYCSEQGTNTIYYVHCSQWTVKYRSVAVQWIVAIDQLPGITSPIPNYTTTWALKTEPIVNN